MITKSVQQVFNQAMKLIVAAVFIALAIGAIGFLIWLDKLRFCV